MGIPPCEAEDARRYRGWTLAEWDERVKAFAYSSPEAAAAVPGLMEIVQDAQAPWTSRRQAALTLGRMGKPAAAAVPVLTGLLAPRNGEETRGWALTALARFGPLAADGTPRALEILDDSREPHLLRLASAELLGQVGPAHPQALPGLIEFVARSPGESSEISPATDLTVACVNAIGLSGPAAAPAVPVLLRQLPQPSDRLRQAALVSLAAIGPAAEIAALSVAEVFVSDPVPLTRDRAAAALVALRLEPVILGLLRSPRPENRDRMLKALATWPRPQTDLLRKAVREIATTETEPSRQALAVQTDWAWTGDAPALAPVAVSLLASSDREARQVGYRLLQELDGELEAVMNSLKELRDHGNPQISRAAEALIARGRRGS